MSSLSFNKVKMLTTPPLVESSIPAVSTIGSFPFSYANDLDQYDEIPLHHGYEQTFFPFRDQELYDRSLAEREVAVCVLENEHLCAEFLPEYGGRLWSLYDKKASRELLFKNSVIRMANLAARNAW